MEKLKKFDFEPIKTAYKLHSKILFKRFATNCCFAFYPYDLRRLTESNLNVPRKTTDEFLSVSHDRVFEEKTPPNF